MMVLNSWMYSKSFLNGMAKSKLMALGRNSNETKSRRRERHLCARDIQTASLTCDLANQQASVSEWEAVVVLQRSRLHSARPARSASTNRSPP